MSASPREILKENSCSLIQAEIYSDLDATAHLSPASSRDEVKKKATRAKVFCSNTGFIAECALGIYFSTPARNREHLYEEKKSILANDSLHGFCSTNSRYHSRKPVRTRWQGFPELGIRGANLQVCLRRLPWTR
jgi:hypothetical protein